MNDAIKSYENHFADIAEIYSRPRVTAAAGAKTYGKIRLVPGWSLDLTMTNPRTGQAWDLSDAATQNEVRSLVRRYKPYLIIGSPPCTAFSLLQNLSKHKRSKDVVDREMRTAKAHVKFCMELYRIQMCGQRFFMHEHPATATSWSMSEVIEVAMMESVEIITIDMCAFGMKYIDSQGESLVKKPTKIMCNSEEILKRLEKRCDRTHQHMQMIGGKAKGAQIYPAAFCEAICEGVAAQKLLGELGLGAIPIMSMEEMSAVVKDDDRHEDPSTFLHEKVSDEIIAFDDVSGDELDIAKVIAARAEEICYFRSMGVYDKVSLQQSYDETGKGPIDHRWIDINKGDRVNANYRSRLVAK